MFLDDNFNYISDERMRERKINPKKEGGSIPFKIMTDKVTMDFEPHRNKTVKYLLSMDCDAVREIYYLKESRSFAPYILDALGITKEYRIEKPGTDKEMFETLKEDKKDKLPIRLTNEDLKKIELKTKRRIRQILDQKLIK